MIGDKAGDDECEGLPEEGRREEAASKREEREGCGSGGDDPWGVAGRVQHEGGSGALALPHVDAEGGRHG